jgi:toxin ParE1/3/4
MASYELSGPADRDLTDIYVYSYKQFGERQADLYLSSLESCFERLAETPDMGRSAAHLRDGYFRFEHARHTIFYVRMRGGIRVMRVLHAQMDPERHILEP